MKEVQVYFQAHIYFRKNDSDTSLSLIKLIDERYHSFLANNKNEFVRKFDIPEEDYQEIRTILGQQGYNLSNGQPIDLIRDAQVENQFNDWELTLWVDSPLQTLVGITEPTTYYCIDNKTDEIIAIPSVENIKCLANGRWKQILGSRQ